MSEHDPDRPLTLPGFLIVVLVAVGAVAIGAILHLAEPVLAPMTLALVTGVILSPIAVSWERIGIPSALGATLNLFVALVAIGGILFLLQPVAMRLVEQAPKVIADVEETLEDVRDAMRGVEEVSKDVADAILMEEGEGEGDSPPASAPPEETAEDSPKEEAADAVPSVADALWLAPSILGQMAVFAGTLFFFLATRGDIYRWTARRLPLGKSPEDRAEMLLEAERRVSRYFLTISMINAGLGLAVFIALRQLGLPGAPVWGLVAFLANFVLYLGPACFFLAMLYAGVANFDGPMALVPALCYVALNFTEAQFVTPSLVGRQMQLNPLVVFLSVVFGIWMWGPVGGIVAIPLLVWLLVLGDADPEPEAETERAEGL
ncbi:AI-2E family transporter [Psychromarinibacter sp. C21-152]|uniref:AI-2E family transporter n=1 Tax=Psychromarinibacter sediminicola TaxID=3033385 RepID=A0AAE3NSI7_9RHOB|nr:AI-2E family transporter [Psychromarinibacter sediminicola]MDF0600839.1 AI-2E family transporter [Psychromarinibacter sediminicola]